MPDPTVHDHELTLGIETKRKPIVAGLGEVLWDILPTSPRLGGAPANFAAHAAALGAEASLVSSIGSDTLGDQTIEILRRRNVETAFVSRNDDPTGTVQVDISGGEPSYTISKNVAWDQCLWGNSLEGFADSLDAVCFGTLFQRSAVSRKTTQRFLAATRPDCLRVFDVNLRQKFYSGEIIVDSLQAANILKLNDSELSIVAKAIGIDANTETFLPQVCERFDLELVALTCGANGSWLGDATTTHFCAATPVAVVDTVGAGDSFAAAVVFGLLNGQPIVEVHEKASQLAAKVCGYSGAVQF